MIKRRIAVLGASFDPPHFGHAAMAVTALETDSADEIWLCPSPSRWDKSQRAPLELRCRWTEILAAKLVRQGFPVHLSLEELSFGNFRGSWFFLHHLARQHPEMEFRLLVGADSWNTIPLWRDPVAGELNGTRILRDFVVLVVPRDPNATLGKNEEPLGPIPQPHILLPALATFRKRWQDLWGLADVGPLGSTAIRNCLAQGRSPSRYCYEDVEKEVRNANPYAAPLGE